MRRKRPRGLVPVAAFMIIAGAAEVLTGFTHAFFGLRTANGATSTSFGILIGLAYAGAGLLILTMRKRAATAAIALLVGVVAGRIAMILMGLYPVETLKQSAAIYAGTSLAAGCAIYIWAKRTAFR